MNFFTRADPLLAVGSVAMTGVPASYVWRCYVGQETSGRTLDMSLAEAMLRHAIAGGEAQGVDSLRRIGMTAHQSKSAAYWRKLNEAAAGRLLA